METTTGLVAAFAVEIQKAAANARREKLLEGSRRLIMRSDERMKETNTRCERVNRLLILGDTLLLQCHYRLEPAPSSTHK